jgi:hypothetical protein
VPYDELKSAGWEEWFGQLRCFDGVHFLQKAGFGVVRVNAARLPPLKNKKAP